MSTPEEIQQDIERTRASLSRDVDRLEDKVSPSRVVHRRVDRVKGSVGSLRERVMGSSDNGSGVQGAATSARGTLDSAKSSVGDAASTVSDAASNAPQMIKQQTQGNPLAAGLVAFGVGWLISSLAPASQAEKNVAGQAEDKAKTLAEPLKQHAQEVADELKEPAQQAAQQVKQTATDAAAETADHAKSRAQDVREPLQQ